MSAREAENGFVRERFVSSQPRRRNIRYEKENDFNEVKNARISGAQKFRVVKKDRRPGLARAG
jgi:hypothetical protein